MPVRRAELDPAGHDAEHLLTGGALLEDDRSCWDFTGLLGALEDPQNLGVHGSFPFRSAGCSGVRIISSAE